MMVNVNFVQADNSVVADQIPMDFDHLTDKLTRLFAVNEDDVTNIMVFRSEAYSAKDGQEVTFKPKRPFKGQAWKHLTVTKVAD